MAAPVAFLLFAAQLIGHAGSEHFPDGQIPRATDLASRLLCLMTSCPFDSLNHAETTELLLTRCD